MHYGVNKLFSTFSARGLCLCKMFNGGILCEDALPVIQMSIKNVFCQTKIDAIAKCFRSIDVIFTSPGNGRQTNEHKKTTAEKTSLENLTFCPSPTFP